MNKKESWKQTLKDILEGFLIALILSFILNKFILVPCTVNGDSMYSTLKDGDYGYSFIIKKDIKIERFDICIVETDDELIVKRIIGMPNDTITYINNELYINGQHYEENYLGDVTTNDFTVTLGDDEYYCLGDNRNISKDSRYFGAFKKDQIKACGFLVVYPFDDFGVKK